MGVRLPGQKVNISASLQRLLNQAKTESNRRIVFGAISPKQQEEFEGRTVWRDTDILIEMKDSFDNQMAEYIAAHELCHALQLSRGYPVAAGRADELGAVAIATRISDFVYDSWADTMAVEFGFPMASQFQRWLESTVLLDALKGPKNGRRYGAKWPKIWERLQAVRVCNQLGLKVPKPPKEFWTLCVALDLANIVQRAENFGLKLGWQIRKDIRRLSLLAKVTDDLLNIKGAGPICDIEESVSKFVSIFAYVETTPGHIFIYKPLIDKTYIHGHWEPRGLPQRKPPIATTLGSSGQSQAKDGQMEQSLW